MLRANSPEAWKAAFAALKPGDVIMPRHSGPLPTTYRFTGWQVHPHDSGLAIFELNKGTEDKLRSYACHDFTWQNWQIELSGEIAECW
jgi:hypothetical protein